MRTSLLAALLLASCGPGGEYPDINKAKYTYNTRCMSIRSDIELDPTRLENNFTHLQNILTRFHLLTPDESCSLSSRTRIHVSELAAWKCTPKKCVTGYYSWAEGITLSNDMSAHLHELLHAWDTAHFVLDTGSHVNWNVNGYNNADIAFVKVLEDITVDE